MKISIDTILMEGPFGGGMQIARYLTSFFEQKGWSVVSHLHDSDIDIIFHINPFPFLMKSSAYSYIDSYRYKLHHPETVIVNGIHGCDERKGTTYMNDLLIRACNLSDYVVFIASWLIPVLEHHGFNSRKPHSVILNGADERVFCEKKRTYWDKQRPLRLVTHHWANHYMKGHDIYEAIEQRLADPDFAAKYSFTYIGNYPSSLSYTRTKIMAPMGGERLAEELRQHDVYVTASRNEPAGLHHIEGALCGLPILYIRSGGLPEYCDGYGICFEPDTFFEALERMRTEFDHWRASLSTYDRTARRMGQQYADLATRLYEQRHDFTDTHSPMIRTLLWFWYCFYGPLFGFYMKCRVRIMSRLHG